MKKIDKKQYFLKLADIYIQRVEQKHHQSI